MKVRHVAGSSVLVAIFAGALLSLGGCPQETGRYLTAQRTGNVNFQFVNTTPFRASFSYGTWDDLDRNPPGPATVLQLRLAANSTSTVSSAPCRRNAAVGTQRFVDRAIDNDADQAANFDTEAFGIRVNFSSAPDGSDAAALPTEGFAEGREVRIGDEYSCNDRLIFTFVQDPAASGGFRIDYEVIKDTTRE